MLRLFMMMAATAAITLSAATVHAQSSPIPSLAEVARQTAAQRQTGKKARKVYTNATLSEVAADVVLTTGAATVSAPAGAIATAPAATAGTAAAPPPGANGAAPVAAGNNANAAKPGNAEDQDSWRTQAASRRSDLEKAKAVLDKQQIGTPSYDQAQLMVTYYQNRWNSFVASAKAANVPAAWLEPLR